MELAQQLMASHPPKKRLLGVLILFSLLLIACQAPSTERGTEEPSLPLAQPALSRTTVLIEPQPGRQCLSTLNPNPFEGLRPRMTGKEVSAVLGPPTRQSVHAKGQKSLEWYRGAWRIVAAYEENTSWGSVWTWKLRGYPIGKASPESILPAEIAARINHELFFVEVLVLNPDRRACFQVIVKEGRVDYVEFVNLPPDRTNQ
jgi:hypothetical protein